MAFSSIRLPAITGRIVATTCASGSASRRGNLGTSKIARSIPRGFANGTAASSARWPARHVRAPLMIWLASSAHVPSGMRPATRAARWWRLIFVSGASRSMMMSPAATLRFHSRTPWRNETTGQTDRVPALIAAFRSLDDDEITAIHRIALTPDGHKLGRRMLGLVQRAAIKLDNHIDDELAVGEGVETCLAARMLGIRPTWALGSVGMISHFPLLPGIRTLRLIGEADAASEHAIALCGERWQRAGRRVRVIKPALNCKDLNDALGAHAYDGMAR